MHFYILKQIRTKVIIEFLLRPVLVLKNIQLDGIEIAVMLFYLMRNFYSFTYYVVRAITKQIVVVETQNNYSLLFCKDSRQLNKWSS